MALETFGNTTNGAGTNIQQDNNNDVGVATLGFGNSGLLDAKSSGENELKIAAGIEKILQDAGKETGIALFLRSAIDELAYSSIVLHKTTGDTTLFFVILLESTGNHGITSSQYMETIAMKRIPFVTSDGIDSVLDDVIATGLDVDSKHVIQIGGLVVPAEHDIAEDPQLLKFITVESNNALEIEASLRSGVVKDINLPQEIQKLNGYLALNYNTLTAPHIDGVGTKQTVSWGVELSTEVYSDKGAMSPNQQGSGKTLTSAKGRINFLPEEYMSEPTVGRPAEAKIGFHPQIIVSSIESHVPTLSNALIGIATSAVVAKDDNWIKPVLDGATNNIGELNRMINVGNEKNPKALDVLGMKRSIEEKAHAIKQLANLDPIISMDAVAFGPNSSVMSVFTSAAGGDTGAAAEIIDTLHEVTNGAFPSNFPRNGIFAGEMIVVPSGTWIDKNGTNRNIDDIDTPFVLNLGANANELIRAYLYGELGQTQDAFSDRCELLQTIEINARIDSRKMRMTFSSDFMTTLLSAMNAAGLTPRFENVGILSKPTGLGFTSGLFNGAGIRNVTSFQSYSPAGGFTDPYRYGMGRH